MDTKPNQIIVIGGGYSIKEGIDKGLWEKIQNLWTLGLNYNYLDFKATFNAWIDPDFYEDNLSGLATLPLVVGQDYNPRKESKNTLFLQGCSEYVRNLYKGVYTPQLCGLWALSLAIYLMDEGEIYLLGYDFGETRKTDHELLIIDPRKLDEVTLKDEKNKPMTHYYQGQRKAHRGVGKIDYFNQYDSKTGKSRVERAFAPYKEETRCKIYNVSMTSKIKIFEKISYDDFFKRIRPIVCSQDTLREYIVSQLLLTKQPPK